MIIKFENIPGRKFKVHTYPWNATDDTDRGWCFTVLEKGVERYIYMWIANLRAKSLGLVLYEDVKEAKQTIKLHDEANSNLQNKKAIHDLINMYNRKENKHSTKLDYGPIIIVSE